MNQNSITVSARRLIKEHLGIDELNEMQLKAEGAPAERDLTLLAPTGSGKTLAFTLAMLRSVGKAKGEDSVKGLIIAPSRELVTQIYSVVRPIVPEMKTVALYGGHNVADETASLKPVPQIVVATPGRLLDHLQRGNVEIHSPACLVIDEYDKLLQLGFEEELKKILRRTGKPGRLILTSATRLDKLPDYLPLSSDAVTIENRCEDTAPGMVEYAEVKSYEADKLNTLANLLGTLGAEDKVIVFVNHRESAERVVKYLKKHGFGATLYHGALDQRERATAVDTLSAGATPVMVATDLAARGLDIDSLAGVVHYHLPVDEQAWIHRNGRTGRQGKDGKVWIITGPDEQLPPYAPKMYVEMPPECCENAGTRRATTAMLCVSAGKKEKISRGDVAGFIAAASVTAPEETGLIRVYDHYSLAAVPARAVKALVDKLNSMRLKGKKVRVSVIAN